MDVAPQSRVHLSVSIVLHDSALELVRRCLHSLQVSAVAAREAGSLGDVTVYLVDNASAGSYRQQLEREADSWSRTTSVRVHTVMQQENRGFGHGHNAVLPRLDSDAHLILNPDVELDAAALHAGLSRLLANNDTVLVSPRASGGNGQQEYLCKAYPSVLVLLLRGFAPLWLRRLFRRQLAAYELRESCSGDEAVGVAIASGCFMLLRTADLRAVGGFNEAFFLYFEDFDLSLRLATRGHLVFDPGMRIVHHGGYAANKGWRHVSYFLGSACLFFRLHGWRWI
ncbi:MAG: glycosyltransferase [Halioglobus sp.]